MLLTRDEWITRAVAYCITLSCDPEDAKMFADAEYENADIQERENSTPEDYMAEALTYYENDAE